MNQDFCFQRLRAYQHARGVLEVLIRNQGLFRGLPGDLGPQMQWAAHSMALNIAEGAGKISPAEQRRHYRIALGSANEVAACADIAQLHGVNATLLSEVLERMSHVVRILLVLARVK